MISNALCESNYSANYKDYIVHKDLQKRFFLALRKKVITSTRTTCKYTNQTCPTRKILCYSHKNGK